MVREIASLDVACCSQDEIKGLLGGLMNPVVLLNLIDDWPARKWSIDEFTKLFGHLQSSFKLYHRKPNQQKKRRKTTNANATEVAMETDCFYVDATFNDFQLWLNEQRSNSPLDQYPRHSYWCYADYNYMAKLFSDTPETLRAVDWSKFGYEGRTGKESTIWIGSEESYTPCHQDSYGCNLIAQIAGCKRWIVFPPNEVDLLKPTRIPYEESSSFSTVDVKRQDIQEKACVIDLSEGEVLYLPKHWWHYVESLTPSISINTWIEQANDTDDRVRESVVNLLVHALKKDEDTSPSTWLNPKQEMSPSLNACLDLIRVALQEKTGRNDLPGLDMNMLINCVTQPSVVDNIVKILTEKLSETPTSTQC